MCSAVEAVSGSHSETIGSRYRVLQRLIVEDPLMPKLSENSVHLRLVTWKLAVEVTLKVRQRTSRARGEFASAHLRHCQVQCRGLFLVECADWKNLLLIKCYFYTSKKYPKPNKTKNEATLQTVCKICRCTSMQERQTR